MGRDRAGVIGSATLPREPRGERAEIMEDPAEINPQGHERGAENHCAAKGNNDGKNRITPHRPAQPRVRRRG